MNKFDLKNTDDHPFFCDKSTWYNLFDGKQYWYVKKVNSFWKEVEKEKIQKNDLDFTEFVFPLLSFHSFWSEGQTRDFYENVDFSNAKFLGQVNFSDVTFHKGANFYMCDFNKGVRISECEFKGILEFSGSNFKSWVRLEGLKAKAKTYFSGLSCDDIFEISKSEFLEEVDFSQSTVNKLFRLNKNDFVSVFEGNDLTILGNTEVRNIRLGSAMSFRKGIFNGRTEFSDLRPLSGDGLLQFQEIDFSNNEKTTFKIFKKLPLLFLLTSFSKEVSFLGIDFSQSLFWNSDITKCDFSLCSFPKSRLTNRTLLHNESQINNIPKNEKERKQAGRKMLKDLYRQLKMNFAQKNDWNESGDAYRSEMLMKIKLLWHEVLKGKIHLLINVLVIGFYGVFSGFQQSIAKPFIWLILLWIGGAMFLHLSQENPGFESAMIESFYAMFPLSGKIDSSPYNESFTVKLVLMRLFSIILITFFVLSTRARLKQ